MTMQADEWKRYQIFYRDRDPAYPWSHSVIWAYDLDHARERFYASFFDEGDLSDIAITKIVETKRK